MKDKELLNAIDILTNGDRIQGSDEILVCRATLVLDFRQPVAEPSESNDQDQTPTSKDAEDGSANNNLMTDAQKRYLFLLLSEKGLEGQAARDELKRLFQVEDLQEVPKARASTEINRLVKEIKGDGQA